MHEFHSVRMYEEARSADTQLSAVLEKEGGRKKEGGREGGCPNSSGRRVVY